MARRGRDNFRFTTVELSALALSFTATSVLVFVLGFYVGRRVAAEHLPVGENVARVPVGTPPSDEAPGRQPQPRPVAPTGQSAAAQHGGQPAAQAAPAAKAPPPASQQVSSKPLTPPSVAQSQAAAQATSPQSPAAPAPAAVAQAPPGVPYTVQVLATRNRNEAENLTNNLKRKGFGAYLVQIDDAGGAWYRVRIGHYDNAEAARRTAERASRELGLTQAYVSPLTSGSR